MSNDYVRVPKRLRCGVSRGQVISLGDRRDFVGACINGAARPQKLANLSFAFSRVGFNLRKQFNKEWWDDFVLVKAPVRGIRDKQPVYVRRDEFEAMSPELARDFERAAEKLK